jgi:cytochrome c oxidase subunit III
MATTIQPPAAKLPSSGETWQRNHEHSSTGILVTLAAICMMFAAIISAMIVRRGSDNDWRHFPLPAILYFNTAALIASSATLEFGKRRRTMRPSSSNDEVKGRSLYVAMILGCAFVVGQWAVWQLYSEGFSLAFSPSSSFFYVLIGLHALYAIGGVLGLTYIASKLHQQALPTNTPCFAEQYWHFITALWVLLLLILRSMI